MDFRPNFRQFELYYFRTRLSRIFAELMSNKALHLYELAVKDVGRLAQGSRIIDIGCGHGTFLCLYLQKYRNVQGTGIDQSRELIKYARRQCSRFNVPANFIVGDAHAIPVDDESFDVIVSHSSIYCWHNPVLAFERFHGALKTGGRLLIYDELPVRTLADFFRALFIQKLFGLGIPAYRETELDGFVKQSPFKRAIKKIDNLIIRLDMTKLDNPLRIDE